MAGKFVVTKGRTGRFGFSLVGRDGRTVATGGTYTTKASCMNGLEAVRTLAADADIEDQTTREWASAQQATETAAETTKKTGLAPRARKATTSRAVTGR